jgi:hypothetical protein
MNADDRKETSDTNTSNLPTNNDDHTFPVSTQQVMGSIEEHSEKLDVSNSEPTAKSSTSSNEITDKKSSPKQKKKRKVDTTKETSDTNTSNSPTNNDDHTFPVSTQQVMRSVEEHSKKLDLSNSEPTAKSQPVVCSTDKHSEKLNLGNNELATQSSNSSNDVLPVYTQPVMGTTGK